MPVRFRCVYCNQLLGIARRKAGSVVRCTNCDGKIIVPQPEESPSAAAKQLHPTVQEGTANSHLFERNDFDDLLKPMRESPNHQFQFDEETVTAGGGIAPRRESDTARLRALSPTGASIFAGRPWLVVASAVTLALCFLTLGYLVAQLAK